MLSYYDLLNVDARASTAEIKEAFRERAKELHPDRNPESGREQREQFAELAEAYEVRPLPANTYAWMLRQKYPGLGPGPLRKQVSHSG